MVTCLLIAWRQAFETNEGGVQDDLQEFAQLMREHFRFDVEGYLLDYTKSAKTIDREIMARCLGVQSDKDELVIIYYTGHAYYQDTMFWSGKH